MFTTADEARRWAAREHKTVLAMQRLMREHGPNRTFKTEEETARRKRGWALVRLRLALDDRSVPENGTDDEIGAYLGFPVQPQAEEGGNHAG